MVAFPRIPKIFVVFAFWYAIDRPPDELIAMDDLDERLRGVSTHSIVEFFLLR